MQIDIITLFPEMITTPLAQSMIGRAQEGGLVSINVHQLRDWAEGKWQVVDDTVYGGGQGMLLQCEPLFKAVADLKSKNETSSDSYVVLMTPQGQVFKQQQAVELGQHEHIIIICGHYEGVDYRVIEELVDLELSIGDYVLTNGAIAATVVVDAVVRLLPEVLGNEQSSVEESFSNPDLLEAPAYTKPAVFRGLEVPPILLSGDHAKISAWRKEQALKRTQKNRPDLTQD